ncbi:hypothetical protein JW898_04390 [Candidatus Woesearchaeota archaeon]|nr:hypothetical protein [Candidatus Woesearchaeota archaeon]
MNQNDIKKMRISNNALFVLAILLIAVNSYTFMVASKDVITGKAGSAAGTTMICIGVLPNITEPSPGSPEIINGTYNTSLWGSSVNFVDFYYYYFGIVEQWFGTDYDAENDSYFNATIDTTTIPDGNCNYRIIARSVGICNTSVVKGSVSFTINNVDVEPIWNEFKNEFSTNFSNYTSWVLMPEAHIVVPDAGRIVFTHRNFDSADLDSMFNISYNNITISVSPLTYACFYDINYLLTFFNITQFAEPVVLRNGVPCGYQCYNFSYDSGDYSFYVRVAGNDTFTVAEGGNLTLDFTFLNFTFLGFDLEGNKTFDNSPTINVTTFMHGSIQDIPISATCHIKTDYDPLTFTMMDITGGINHSHTLPEQNWSYLPTNMGHYPEIQHHDYYSGAHVVTVNCSAQGQEAVKNNSIYITYTQRDRVYYADGDTVEMYLHLEEPDLNISVDFSQIDSNFDPANVTVINDGLDYNISYNISHTNTKPDAQYNITIEASNSTGHETMNGTIFMYLHNTWLRSDIDDAFDCWSFKQGYYFDEVACDWESDLNHVTDNVDAFTVEVSCFDTIDNDLDGKTDINDTDCAGIYYTIRRSVGINSAFLGDPCFNNVCRVCLGDSDNNDDGICDSSVGVNVRYLNKVRPGQTLRAKFNKASINNLSVRVSINYLNDSFDVRDSTSSIEQLPRKELGGCAAGANCKSVTGTTFGPGLPDRFTGELNERINITLSAGSHLGPHPYLAAGKSIGGSSAFQNMVFFEVTSDAIANESDNATYCFDREDNDLNDQYDCFDISCNLTYNPANASQRCEYPHEITCDDGYDNDWDGYTDCQDNDCFQKNGTTGPCYAVENFNATSCADSINNDFDWGTRCNSSVSASYQTRQTNGTFAGTISLTDCLDIDCNGQVGNTLLGAICQYCTEITCNDYFDNDADHHYDCTGNAYRSSYERDCDRWHDVLLTCPMTELNCSDELDNDLDSDSMNGEYLWMGLPVYGGWDCQDLDCIYKIGDEATGALCEYRNETICDDKFDNDRDGYTDCEDPTSCKGLSGADFNMTGLCRPCAEIENISIDACRDGDDNDYDGPIDCADINCSGLPGPGIGLCGLTENNCTDGIDNDYDWLTDANDPDCATAIYTTDELGPGQCHDSIDNDNDGPADCADPDCAGTMICVLGSYNNPCYPIGYVGAIQVGRIRYVHAGDNFTACYTRNSLNTDSVVLKLGNIEHSLRNISPLLDNTTSFMTGTTTNFVKVNDTHGLKAQNDDGFSGNLNLNLTSTTDSSTIPGTYTLFISTSIPGVYSTTTTTTYIAENEPPTIDNITIAIGNVMTGPDEVKVQFTVNATDNGTYNSGIAFCTMNLSGVFVVNSSTCSHSANLTSGTYNISAIAYDGAMNPSDLFWREFTFTAATIPTQSGGFYNPHPAENYPDKNFFNDTEKLNIGVNFEGGSGFDDNDTGCVVNIRNSTHIVSTQYVNLSVVSDEAHCTGQVDLSPLMNLTNASNSSVFPSAVYYFDVTVQDNSSMSGTSTMEDFHFCHYYYDNASSKYRCRDACEEMLISNRPPALLSDIPNQTWPRGTKLSVIDLDDYFIDPDNDPITYTWVIDNPRINVSIDRTNLVTFAPDQTFYGFAYITFYANDYFTSTPSNIIMLEVLFTPLPQIPPIPAGGGGGGGANLTKIEICEEDWICTDWGPCLPSGYQFRTCRDRNECGSTNKMPNTTRECIYIPTCKDKIRNQGETGIDCGGPCPPCPSCTDSILNQQEEKVSQIMSADTKDRSDCGGPFCPVCPTCEDNIMNQGEENVDCGGPCGPCATCNDGIRNQGEVNIDCGGPCPSCKVHIEAKAFNWNLLLLIVSSLLLLLLLLLALLFGVFKKKFIRLKAKLLNYYMRLVRMFEKKKLVERELPILQWANVHLTSIEEQIPSKDEEHLANEVDKLVRILFKRVFLIRYAFTNDELVKELDKHKVPTVLKKAVEILFEELSQIKYGGESVDKEEIRTLIGQVRVITERLVNEIETKKKTKISISERDIEKISETLSGADKLGISETMKKMRK